jgi:hypothetical protein
MGREAMSIVLYSPMFGALAVEEDDDDTVAFAFGERMVRVDYCVGDFEDLGDDEKHVIHAEHVEVMR